MGRTAIAGVALAIGLIASVTFAVTFGPADIRIDEVWASILSHLGIGDSPLSTLRDGIVWELRLPRVLTAAAVGAGLAISGAVMQAITRNPLADPYLLGLSSGASLGAVSVLLLGVAVALPLAAFAGAMVALVVTLLLASSLGAITPTRTVLAGLAVSSLAGAVTSLVIFWTVTGDSYREILGWLLGSLAGARWPAVAIAFTAILIAGVPIALGGRVLDAFAFGDATAASLGVNVAATRWVLLTASALLTGAMVSVSGSIGFVGLVLPHAVRLLVGPGHRALLPLAALTGAIFLVWADTAARTLFDPRELPVGIVTAIIGAPVFALLLARRRSAT
ncbi:iron chelate uptake ABC transporter family permease subunit [Leifsonia sp. H3M29-4]|uniref:putative F420-0 ABC transporter permease subunit n=1 Tax=Salinibacterium metalliresistens TaxID=3031321 RepID=UPI0023DCDAD6|nr:putative F420-0 ABC transporter permease subunit [Salinibacterium metalliresistens]MDF1479610.1 iron chelate uptake ABC transporter family permease subunit [Salinibacterium metalliresistens]